MSLFSELSPELSGRSPQELMRWFADPVSSDDIPEEDFDLLLEEVAVYLAETGPVGLDFLVSCAPGADELHARAILLGLSFAEADLLPAKRTSIEKLVRRFLDDKRPMVVAGAVDALKHLQCKNARAEVLGLLQHPSPDVVGSVLRFMAEHFPKDAVPLLEQALESPEPLVRENAIDELDEMGYAPALPKIKRLLKDANKDVRQAARTAVANLEKA